MDSALRSHYAQVEDLFTEAEFEEAVQQAVERSGHLLDRDVAALRVVDEAGRNEGAVVGLADLEGRSEATVRARVHRVGDVRSFDHDGGGGRVANVHVHDAHRRARVVLWNEDVEVLDELDLGPGDVVKVVNARVKRTSYGLELHAGRWSTVELDGSDAADALPRDPPEDDAAAIPAAADGPGPDEVPTRPPTDLADVEPGDRDLRVEAEVVRVEPTRTFRRDGGDRGFLAKAHLRDASGRGVLTAWDDHVRDLQGFDPGDRVEATGLRAKAYRGKTELHTTRGTTLRPPEG